MYPLALLAALGASALQLYARSYRRMGYRQTKCYRMKRLFDFQQIYGISIMKLILIHSQRFPVSLNTYIREESYAFQ